MTSDLPLVLLDPAPRRADEIFSPTARERLHARYRVIERAADEAARDDTTTFYRHWLPDAHYVIGQPPLDGEAIRAATRLRAIVNVEGNFLQNMNYAACFETGVHVLSIGPVFARPVAELALGLTLALARDIPAAHAAFATGEERYGLDGNHRARTLHRCRLGFVGFGDLGRAILSVFAGFEPVVRIHDPWLSPEALARDGLDSVGLDELLATSDVVQVVASVTPDSTNLIGTHELSLLPDDALLVLLSRADVMDFDALRAACASGRLRAATDVLPVEPLPLDDPLRNTPNLLLSAHRAGALDSALIEIGDRVLADLTLMSAGLPPQNCKRAERELVTRLRSRPVARS